MDRCLSPVSVAELVHGVYLANPPFSDQNPVQRPSYVIIEAAQEEGGSEDP